MKILKFGGTSVGNTENIKKVATIATQCGKCIVVLSAMSGTTDILINITAEAQEEKKEVAIEHLNVILDNYVQQSKQLLATIELLNQYEQFVDEIRIKTKSLLSYNFTEQIKNQVISTGEILTSKLFSLYLLELGVLHKLLWADNFISIDENRNPILSVIKNKLLPLLDKEVDIYITQGFICKNALNQIDTFTRGGSDYTATIIGAVVDAEEVQIWTDIDGMHNNDPRYVSGTSTVTHLSFEEAEELAYFGAKILHPLCIEPVKRKSIPILIKNTMNTHFPGTLISNTSFNSGLKAIAAKDNITCIKIKSAKMMLAHGFLKQIFEIFDTYQTSVDMIATSEITVSLTIDDTKFLNKIVSDLSKIGDVEVIKDQTLICIVGDLKEKRISNVLRCISHIPLQMISYGVNTNNIVLVISSVVKNETLQELNNNLFTESHVCTKNHC